MKVKTLVATDLKLTLAGMITDSVVLSRIASQWTEPEGLFDDDDANVIARWCIRHLEKYGESPKERILTIFDAWAENKTVSEDRAVRLESKLREVSREQDRQGIPNGDYILDRAGKYFNEVRLKREWEASEDELDRGQVEEAYSRLTGMSRVNLGIGATVHLAEDYLAWREILAEDRDEPLLYYPKGLDKFINPMTSRENFLTVMAPDKSYKSFWIMDAGFRGIKNRKRVAYFEVGDMTKTQIMRRMAERWARRPIRAGKFKIPISARYGDDGLQIEWDVRVAEERLTPQEVFRAVKRSCRGQDWFRLSCHLNDSIDVYGLESILKDWSRTGWVPDIVLVDYADILAPPKGIKDPLEQIDKTWKALRRMSQEYHCLVVTGTQSNAAAYSKKEQTLSKKHFSGRKTKLAHATGIIGLNVTDEYRDKNVTGLNWIARRDGKYTERFMFRVAGCFDIANPAMKVVEKFQKKPETSTDDDW